MSRSSAPETLAHERDGLEDFLFPYWGRRPIAEITALDVLASFRRTAARGTFATAHRTKSICSRVLRYAIATGGAERDVRPRT